MFQEIGKFRDVASVSDMAESAASQESLSPSVACQLRGTRAFSVLPIAVFFLRQFGTW